MPGQQSFDKSLNGRPARGSHSLEQQRGPSQRALAAVCSLSAITARRSGERNKRSRRRNNRSQTMNPGRKSLESPPPPPVPPPAKKAPRSLEPQGSTDAGKDGPGKDILDHACSHVMSSAPWKLPATAPEKRMRRLSKTSAVWARGLTDRSAGPGGLLVSDLRGAPETMSGCCRNKFRLRGV